MCCRESLGIEPLFARYLVVTLQKAGVNTRKIHVEANVGAFRLRRVEAELRDEFLETTFHADVHLLIAENQSALVGLYSVNSIAVQTTGRVSMAASERVVEQNVCLMIDPLVP